MAAWLLLYDLALMAHEWGKWAFVLLRGLIMIHQRWRGLSPRCLLKTFPPNRAVTFLFKMNLVQLLSSFYSWNLSWVQFQLPSSDTGTKFQFSSSSNNGTLLSNLTCHWNIPKNSEFINHDSWWAELEELSSWNSVPLQPCPPICIGFKSLKLLLCPIVESF